jgi:hypothetical protein
MAASGAHARRVEDRTDGRELPGEPGVLVASRGRALRPRRVRPGGRSGGDTFAAKLLY